jgi:hypothetical protein
MVTEYGGSRISRLDGELRPVFTRTGVATDAQARGEPVTSGDVIVKYVSANAPGAPLPPPPPPPSPGVYGNSVGDKLRTVIFPAPAFSVVARFTLITIRSGLSRGMLLSNGSHAWSGFNPSNRAIQQHSSSATVYLIQERTSCMHMTVGASDGAGMKMPTQQ